MSPARSRTAAVRRLAAALLVVGAMVAGVTAASSLGSSYTFPAPTPKADCGPGARPETSIQGRVPTADYDSRPGPSAATAATPRQVSPPGRHRRLQGAALPRPRRPHLRVLRLDAAVPQGRADATSAKGPRRRRPRHGATRRSPRQTDQLTSPGDAQPARVAAAQHEARAARRRARQPGAPTPGVARPVRRADRLPAPEAALQHPDRRCSATRAAGRPDGRTFYVTGTGGQTLGRVDVSDPAAPKAIFTQSGVNYHGAAGHRRRPPLYVANIGNSRRRRASPAAACGSSTSARSRTASPTRRCTVLVRPDLARALDPAGRRAVHPQRPPATCSRSTSTPTTRSTAAPTRPAPGGRRPDHRRRRHPRSPSVVSDIRLAGAPARSARRARSRTTRAPRSPVQGYAAHYCSVPTRDRPEPRRLLDDPLRPAGLRHPRRAAPRARSRYFNQPLRSAAGPTTRAAMGAFAMSQPAWDVAAPLGLVHRRQLRLLRRPADQRRRAAARLNYRPVVRA